ncbi:hypothetical protein Pint_27180 [Pistacia integerrima]|uniref:Uncharacterized protein n=1 Tax=Pistacia integerrima TaxID=434235 RepID=A0ACC0YPL3_9ROSI|nr:hypothetical protein Pint_27180 [Pistacia integerrima]
MLVYSLSDPDSKGYFDLLIKVYPEGKMSQHFASLKPEDVVEVKGPFEKLRYSPNMKKHIGMHKKCKAISSPETSTVLTHAAMPNTKFCDFIIYSHDICIYSEWLAGVSVLTTHQG